MKSSGLTRSAAILLALSFSVTATSIASAEKKSGNNKKTGSTPAATAGTWVLPSTKAKSPIIVQAGRSVPIKFKLSDATGQVTSTDMVQVTLNALNSCEVGAAIKGTSVDIFPATPLPLVSPTPSVSPTASASPSSTSSTSENEESKKNELKVEKGTFSYVWKIAKNQAVGCYQLVAKKGSAIATSPLLKIKSK
jgi:hypothetical protein